MASFNSLKRSIASLVEVTIQTRARHYSSKLSLKPFYLAVHPDLFHAEPVAKKVNEESLKIFHAYLNNLEADLPVFQLSLIFYKKVRDVQGDDVPVKVTLHIKSCSKDSLIENVLKTFGLSHHTPCDPSLSYQQQASDPLRGRRDRFETFSSKDEDEALSFVSDLNFGIFKGFQPVTILEWFEANVDIALKNRKHSSVLVEENWEILERLKRNYGIAGVSSDSTPFAFGTINNILKQFEKLLDRDSTELDFLFGRWVCFGRFNGFDQFGRFVLNVNDVQEDWRMGLLVASRTTELIHKISGLEKTLQASCDGLKFVKSRVNSIRPMLLYYNGLKFMCQNLSPASDVYEDTKSYGKLSAFPDWYADFMAISKEGSIKIPIHTGRKSLYNFIDKNYALAQSTRKEYLRNLAVEQTIIRECKNVLSLQSLTKEYAVSTGQLVESCKKLMELNMKENLKDSVVIISNYYNVSSDGTIRIPWYFLS